MTLDVHLAMLLVGLGRKPHRSRSHQFLYYDPFLLFRTRYIHLLLASTKYVTLRVWLSTLTRGRTEGTCVQQTLTPRTSGHREDDRGFGPP